MTTQDNPGAYLKSVREGKGYSIAEASKNTRIASSVLRALEEGRLDNIDLVYLKGFLKMYCRFLGIDWQEFSKEYPLPAPLAKHTSEAKESPRQPASIKNSFISFILEKKKLALAGFLAVIGVFFIVLVFKGCIAAVKKPSSLKPSAIHKVTAPPGLKPAKTITPPQKVVPPSQAKTAAHPIEAKPANKPKAYQPAAEEYKLKEITLVIRAREESFVKVKVDGRAVYQGILRKGNAETWTAKEKIELSIGNAAGILLEVDGRVFSSLGRKGQPLKNILITREGLKIGQ